MYIAEVVIVRNKGVKYFDSYMHEIKNSGWEGDMYWDATIKVLEVLSGLYDGENVRLVVWFED